MQIFWITLSAALAISIPALATAWAQSRIGPAAAASLAGVLLETGDGTRYERVVVGHRV